MIKVLKNYECIYTLEEHFPVTGIKSIISSHLSDKKVLIQSINNQNDFIHI